VRAIQLSDLSLTVPLITLTPLFILLTGPVVVNEYPTSTDVVGILLIVAGAYCLNIRGNLQALWSPFVSLWRNRGSRMMLFVAFLWSFSSVVDKVGVQNSSPLFWVTALLSFIALGMWPIIQSQCPRPWRLILKHWRVLAPIGIFQGLAVLVQMQAIQLTSVARVIAIKRMSALLSVIWGGIVLKEMGLRDRLFGTCLMVAGVFVIAGF
ncbi:MAG: DMT family transporter, partial [Cyanobacteria bacterium P01_F01_bin.42]